MTVEPESAPDIVALRRGATWHSRAIHWAVGTAIATALVVAAAILAAGKGYEKDAQIALALAGALGACSIASAIFSVPFRGDARRLRDALGAPPPRGPAESRFRAEILDERGGWLSTEIEDLGPSLLLRRRLLPDALLGLPTWIAWAAYHARSAGFAGGTTRTVVDGAALAVLVGQGLGVLLLRGLRAGVELAYAEEAPVAAIRRAEVRGREILLYGEDDLEPAERLRMYAETRGRFIARMQDRFPFTVVETPKAAGPTLAAPVAPRPERPRRSLRRPPRALSPAESLKALDAAKRTLDGLP
jgi:hypothetical protein